MTKEETEQERVRSFAAYDKDFKPIGKFKSKKPFQAAKKVATKGFEEVYLREMNQKRNGVKLKHYLLSVIEVERKNPPEYLMNLANEDGKVMMKQGKTEYQGQVPMPENLVF